MAIFAISDLHLSFGVDKPMNVFGKIWDNYEEIYIILCGPFVCLFY